MTTDDAGLLIATLAAAYPRQQLEPATIEVYARSLADLDHDLAAAAVARIIASSTFFPSIAEIRTMAAELVTGLPGPTQAWTLAANPNSRTGPLPDAVAEALSAVGGSWALRRTTNLETFRSQFRRAYEEIRQREIDAVVFASSPAPELDRGERLALREASLLDDARFVRTDPEEIVV